MKLSERLTSYWKNFILFYTLLSIFRLSIDFIAILFLYKEYSSLSISPESAAILDYERTKASQYQINFLISETIILLMIFCLQRRAKRIVDKLKNIKKEIVLEQNYSNENIYTD